MKTGESESELAVYDSLIGGLADHAGRSDATSDSFFAKMSHVVEAIFAPDWSAVLARGSADSPVPIYSTGGVAKDRLGELFSSGDMKDPLSGLLKRGDELGDSGVIVSPIGNPIGNPSGTNGNAGSAVAADGNSLAWGCIVVQVGRESIDLVQSNVMMAIAETAQEFVRNEERRQSQAIDQLGTQFLDFSVNAHSSLEPRVVGHHLANDARLILGCERVSVFMLGRRSPKLLAISSVASVEGRSQLLKQMNSMIGRAVRLGQPIISDHTSSDQRLASLVESHCNTTGLPFAFGVTVNRRSEQAKQRLGSPVGFLLAESTSDIDRVKFARGLGQVLPHVATSLSNANTYSQIPFRRTFGWLGRMSSFANLSRMGLTALLVGLLVAASLFFKIDFKVRIPGELRPAVERNVFAAHDGVIEKVFIDHGDKVEANQPLMQIRSTEYEVELEKASSDILKLQQLKEAKQISLNRVSSVGSDQNLAAQLASEISDLDFQIASQEGQAKFLTQQIAELLIKCPIDGQVTTWQSKENLTNRPVRWGDTVLNVAQLDGEWDLVFRVPERRIGYILKRDRELGADEALELEFFLESDPGKKYRVEVKKIDSSAIEDSEFGPVTILKCAAPAELANKRQGATLSGDLDCGRKSAWFVWTREMFDAIRRKFVW